MSRPKAAHPPIKTSFRAATDKRRAAYVKRYFGQDWTDRRLYHMMINSCMGFEAMIQAAIDGAGLTELVGAGKRVG